MLHVAVYNILIILFYVNGSNRAKTWYNGICIRFAIKIIIIVELVIVLSLSVFSVKELSEGELREEDETTNDATVDEKYSLIDAAKLLVANKYYVMICVTYILQQLYGAMLGVGTYYMKYVMGNENLFSYFAWAINIPLIIALVITPSLVLKWKGMYKLNFWGYALGTLGRALVVVAAYMGNLPLMFLFTGVAAFGMGPWQGDMNAVIAECSQYTYLTKGKRVDGTMYS